MKLLLNGFIVLWQGIAMANDYSQKIQQLTDQYRKQVAVITANEKDPKSFQEKINKITDEYQKSIQEIQQTQSQKSDLSRYTEALKQPHSEIVVDKSKAQSISPETLNDLMKHPEKHSWSDWLLASNSLHKSGAKRQAYFAWSVFKVLGFAVAKLNAGMNVVRMDAEKKFGNELVKQIAQDPDIWAKLLRESIDFCKKVSWDHQNPGAKAAANEFYEMNKDHFSEEGLKKIKAEREKNNLPVKKLTVAELGPELPTAWIL